jgi:hypothetical protein
MAATNTQPGLFEAAQAVATDPDIIGHTEDSAGRLFRLGLAVRAAAHDAIVTADIRRQLGDLAAYLEERLEDEERDSGLILDGLPDRLYRILKGS